MGTGNASRPDLAQDEEEEVMESRQDIVRSYLSKFPDAKTTTLAKKAYKENGVLWASFDSCRSAFRYARGNMGKRHRTKARPENKKPNGGSREGFESLPDGLTDIEDYSPVSYNEPGDYLVLGDVHCPYHDRKALKLALESCPNPQGILLNGDFQDHYGLSKWEKDPRRRDFAKELDVGREMVRVIRNQRPHARIIWKLGNHEERYERYMQIKAPELLNVPDFEIEHLYRCKEYGIEIVKDMRPITIGKLYVLHGHEYRCSISNPVNPARGLFLRSKTLALCSHFHQSSNHSENTLDDRRLVCFSTGCLCDLHPRYMPLNKWNHGFAIVNIDSSGSFTVQNHRIIGDKVY